MSQIRPVLLSGGSGTRLWPLSRALFPKQLQALLPGTPWSLLQETGRRVSDRTRFGKAIIVSNDEHRFAVAAQLEEAGLAFDAPILEPVGRNTAPAITVAALVARENGEDPLLLVLPSDHHVGNVGAFHEAIRRGKHAAEAGELVMFGMQP
nr:sugar phosphate nucleotidyltransferase [Micropepsaceae bacterium]